MQDFLPINNKSKTGMINLGAFFIHKRLLDQSWNKLYRVIPSESKQLVFTENRIQMCRFYSDIFSNVQVFASVR